MHAWMLTLAVLAQDPATPPSEESPAAMVANEPAAPATGEAPPTAQPTPPQEAEAGDNVVAPAAAPRASSVGKRASGVPVETSSPYTPLRKATGVAMSVAGAFLVALGLAALGGTALVELSPWPDHPDRDEYPRKTLGVVGAALTAVSLMVGATILLAGLAAVFI